MKNACVMALVGIAGLGCGHPDDVKVGTGELEGGALGSSADTIQYGGERLTPWPGMSQLFESTSGARVWVSVYGNDTALGGMTEDGQLPKGSLLVRTVFADPDGRRLKSITSMRKFAVDSRPDTDGWQWTQSDSDGTVLIAGADANQRCSGCHAARALTNDWVLSIDLRGFSVDRESH